MKQCIICNTDQKLEEHNFYKNKKTYICTDCYKRTNTVQDNLLKVAIDIELQLKAEAFNLLTAIVNEHGQDLAGSMFDMTQTYISKVLTGAKPLTFDLAKKIHKNYKEAEQ